MDSPVSALSSCPQHQSTNRGGGREGGSSQCFFFMVWPDAASFVLQESDEVAIAALLIYTDFPPLSHTMQERLFSI